MKARGLVRGMGIAAGALGVAYGTYVVWAWLGYGRPRHGQRDEADEMLDRFMPRYDVVERHTIFVHAPAEITLAAAREVRLDESRIVRAVFRGREILLGAKPAASQMPQGLVAQMKVLGWSVLGEAPGREIVMGAITQPWRANVEFRAIPSEAFPAFRESGYVKIAWTLRAKPITASTSIFRTETRALACGPQARSKFRMYWALLSPGITLIRSAVLSPLRREAERRARARVIPV
jgi:hypothetical protein